MKYYSVRIKVTTTDDKGKEKTHTEEYMVSDTSVTGAEARIAEYFKGTSNFNYQVSSVRETKVIEVIK